MDFTHSEEHNLLRASVKQMLSRYEHRKKEWREMTHRDHKFNYELWNEFANLGLFGCLVPGVRRQQHRPARPHARLRGHLRARLLAQPHARHLHGHRLHPQERQRGDEAPHRPRRPLRQDHPRLRRHRAQRRQQHVPHRDRREAQRRRLRDERPEDLHHRRRGRRLHARRRAHHHARRGRREEAAEVARPLALPRRPEVEGHDEDADPDGRDGRRLPVAALLRQRRDPRREPRRRRGPGRHGDVHVAQPGAHPRRRHLLRHGRAGDHHGRQLREGPPCLQGHADRRLSGRAAPAGRSERSISKPRA